MEINFFTTALTISVVAISTALTRAIPYLLFGKNKTIPKNIHYLGTLLPASIMIILVIYCLRNINFSLFPFGLAELFSVFLVAMLQIIMKTTFLSILLGTLCYMTLIHIFS